jgi:hypothetical protein
MYSTSVVLKNSVFCPKIVFMSFVWYWDYTAIISLNIINQLIFNVSVSHKLGHLSPALSVK